MIKIQDLFNVKTKSTLKKEFGQAVLEFDVQRLHSGSQVIQEMMNGLDDIKSQSIDKLVEHNAEIASSVVDGFKVNGEKVTFTKESLKEVLVMLGAEISSEIINFALESENFIKVNLENLSKK